MTLTGEVVAYVDPPSRSPWAEPNPEHDDLQADDVEAVAEAAAEIVTADLDAELAELTPDADGHLFSQYVNRRSMAMLTDLKPTERLMFVGHALAMGPASSHHWKRCSSGCGSWRSERASKLLRPRPPKSSAPSGPQRSSLRQNPSSREVPRPLPRVKDQGNQWELHSP